MRVHILQHVPFEDIGSIGDWLKNRQASVTWTRFFESPELPELETVDWVIAMGGPMSVNDEALFPWLTAEKQFIAQAISQGKSVLGICLGAQLMASALGARVYAGAEKEIGWYPIQAVTSTPGTFAFPAEADVFHWHGETFDLPSGAIHLARSEACTHQSFQVGRRGIGLQFHLEITPTNAASMLAHCGDELVPSRFIQTAEQIGAKPSNTYAAINALMVEVLDYLATEDANGTPG